MTRQHRQSLSAPPVPTHNEGTSTGVVMDVPLREAVPAHLLDGGEVVHFAVKPSPWFVFFASGRVLALSTLIAIFSYTRWAPVSYSGPIFQAALALAGVRIAWAMLDWASRLYVLTNRRVMSIKGVGSATIYAAPLQSIDKTWTEINSIDAVTGIGTVWFDAETEGMGNWRLVRRPGELHERLKSAIRNVRHGGDKS